MDELNQYVIAVARRARVAIPGDWVAKISAIEGVVIEQQGEFSLRIRATSEVVQRVRDLFGADLIIEEPIERRPLRE